MSDLDRKRQMHACNCVGPRNGQPLCPCAMRGVTIKDGRYVQEIDHGPVRPLIKSDWPKWSYLDDEEPAQ